MIAMKRTERIQIRVTPAEREQIDRARGPAPISNWARNVMLLSIWSELLFLENLAVQFSRKAEHADSEDSKKAWKSAAAMVRRRLGAKRSFVEAGELP